MDGAERLRQHVRAPGHLGGNFGMLERVLLTTNGARVVALQSR